MALIRVTVSPAEFATRNGVRMMTIALAAPALYRVEQNCRNVSQARDLLDSAAEVVKRAHPGQGFHARAMVQEGRKPPGFDAARLRLDFDPSEPDYAAEAAAAFDAEG